MEKECQFMEKTQINIEKNQKEIKKHGDYAFPVEVSIEEIGRASCRERVF